MDIPINSTDQWVRVRAMTSAGAALTGKVAADFAFWYTRHGAAPVSITPLADKSPGDAHADGGVYEEGRGWYWVGVPDAAFVTGVPSVGVSGTVAGGVLIDAPIRLTPLTAEAIADQVWDEAKSEHTTAGTFGLWLGTKLWNWLGALMGKTADAATRAEINATTAGAGYNETTDSLEANRDNIGAAGAGLTAVGAGSSLTAQEVRDAMKLAPTAGDPAAESIDKHLDDILEDTAALAGTSGAYACTWTVDDGTDELQNATVSFWLNGVLKGTGTTDADGEVSMSLDAATYDVAIVCDGYTFSTTTHTVSSTASTWTETFSMTEVSSPASTEPDTVTVRWRVKKADRTYCGAAEGTVYFQIIDGPGTAGFIYHGDNEDFDSETTDANGYVNFTNVPIPCTIAIKTGTSRKLKTFEIPSTATSPYDAGELVSHDA